MADDDTYKGKLFDYTDDDPVKADTGYYKDMRGVWWLIKREVTSPLDGGKVWQWTYAPVTPGNVYKVSPGFVMGTASSPQGAVDAVNEAALRIKLQAAKPSGSIVGLLVLLALLWASDNKGKR